MRVSVDIAKLLKLRPGDARAILAILWAGIKAAKDNAGKDKLTGPARKAAVVAELRTVVDEQGDGIGEVWSTRTEEERDEILNATATNCYYLWLFAPDGIAWLARRKAIRKARQDKRRTRKAANK